MTEKEIPNIQTQGENMSNNNQEEINRRRDLIAAHKRRLHERRMQLARSGHSADPIIKIEIDDIENEIRQLEREILSLSMDENYQGNEDFPKPNLSSLSQGIFKKASVSGGIIASVLRNIDMVSDWKERRRLYSLFVRINQLSVGQIPLADALEEYRIGGIGDPWYWSKIIGVIVSLDRLVSDALEIISKSNGKFAIEFHDVYQSLLSGLVAREAIYKEILSMPEPTEEHDFESLLRMSNAYRVLVEELKLSEEEYHRLLKEFGHS